MLIYRRYAVCSGGPTKFLGTSERELCVLSLNFEKLILIFRLFILNNDKLIPFWITIQCKKSELQVIIKSKRYAYFKYLKDANKHIMPHYISKKLTKNLCFDNNSKLMD